MLPTCFKFISGKVMLCGYYKLHLDIGKTMSYLVITTYVSCFVDCMLF